MIRPNHPDQDAFAEWLDARRSFGPVSDIPLETSDNLSAAREGAMKVDVLNRDFEQRALAAAPEKTSLESIFAAASVPPPVGRPNRSTASQWKESGVKSRSAQSISPEPISRIGVGTTLNRIVSVTAIVAIVLAAGTSVWFNRDPLGFGGGGDGPEPLSYATFMLPDGEAVEIAYDVPTAEDCTVEPLTVDEVMAKLNASPFHSQRYVAAETEVIAMLDAGTPIPNSGYRSVSPLSEQTHREIAAVQREWLACSLFGTPLQRWSLETNERVQREFQQRYMPIMDLGLIQQDLEELAAGGQNLLSGPRLTDESMLPMVPAYVNGYYNIMWNVADADITIFWVRPDGTALLNFGETEADLEPYLSAPSLEQQLPNVWNFHLDLDTGQWLLADMSLMGG
jgi:hypothetical protein